MSKIDRVKINVYKFLFYVERELAFVFSNSALQIVVMVRNLIGWSILLGCFFIFHLFALS